jgi:AcrR family transcriptional regulator
MSQLVTKEEYYDAALEVLAQLGFKGLNIGVLCNRLGVTSGSFYHHFGNWQAFVAALLDAWENRQIVLLREQAFGTAGPQNDLELLISLTLGLNHSAEAAIRAWSRNDETVGIVQKRVDNGRYKTNFKVIKAIVGDRRVARVVTALGSALLIGYQQQSTDDDHAELSELLDEYVRLIYSHSTLKPV